METPPVRWPAARTDAVVLAGLVLLLLIIRYALARAAGFDLHYEEAHYWTWAQHLDWSYYSKGPLTAWLIALSTTLFGDGEWQVRLFAWLAHGAFLVLAFFFARDVWQDRRAAQWTVILLLLTPVYFTLGLAMTTDVLMFVFWTWGLWALYRALYQQQRRAWYEAGAAVGIGALAKLSIGLLPLFAGVVMLFKRQWRQHFKDPHLWGGLALLAACMSPMLLWNAANDWVMFRHELGHVDHEGWSPARVPRFLGGQLLAVSPIIALLLIGALYRPPAHDGRRLLWSVSVLCLGFFLIKALSAKVQMNWPAPAYIGLMILFAGHAARYTGIRHKTLQAGLALSVVLLIFAYFPASLGLPGDRDPFKDTKAWRGPVTELSTRVNDVDFILTHSYKLASELAFYWPRPIDVYVTGSKHRRRNQFDLWPGLDREAGGDGIYISTLKRIPRTLRRGRAFDACTRLEAVPARASDGTVLRTLYARLCRNYHPVEWPEPTDY